MAHDLVIFFFPLPGDAFLPGIKLKFGIVSSFKEITLLFLHARISREPEVVSRQVEKRFKGQASKLQRSNFFFSNY